MTHDEDLEEDPILFDVVESLDITEEETESESYNELDFEKVDLDNNQVEDFYEMREAPYEEGDLLD